MKYRVVFSQAAAEDLEQLFDFALQRELDSETGDLNIPEKAVQAIKNGVAFLTSSPFACRKVGSSSFIRELIIPFGHTGYVALFEIVDSNTVIIGAIRHQREDDYQ
jgi:plasmid stabilization system protein ParE